jgi:WD40 repeat protein
LLIGVTDQGEVVVLETATWREVARQKWPESPIVSMSISTDGNYLVTGEDDRKVRLGTINPLRQIGIIGEHNARVKAVAFSPDSRYVASAGDDKMVALWNVSRRKLVTTIGTHTSPIYALAFSSDGKRLITGEHDRSVRQYTRQRTLWGFRWSNRIFLSARKRILFLVPDFQRCQMIWNDIFPVPVAITCNTRF